MSGCFFLKHGVQYATAVLSEYLFVRLFVCVDLTIMYFVETAK